MTTEVYYMDDKCKMDSLFRARELELDHLKNQMSSMKGAKPGNDRDLLFVLRSEMVELMERDVKLWKQLTSLNHAVNTLRRDLISTRCRSNSLSSFAESDEGLFEDEVHEEIRTKPRSYTVLSTTEELSSLRGDIFPILNNKHFSPTTDFHLTSSMKDAIVSFSSPNRNSSFPLVFSSFNIKSGIFDLSRNRLRKHTFLSGWNTDLIDLVGDLIKPSSSKQILPRRKLHRQSNVSETDDGEVLPTDDNLHNTKDDYRSESIHTEPGVRHTSTGDKPLTNESKSKLQVDCRRDTLESETVSKYEANEHKTENTTGMFENGDPCVLPDTNKTTEEKQVMLDDDVQSTRIHKNIDALCDEGSLNSDKSETDMTDNENDDDNTELEDITFKYLIFQDGCVSCRIMTPGLEQQIKLKHETEEEPLEYLRCQSGFARFRSGSDTESIYSTDSRHSDDDLSIRCIDDESDEEEAEDIYNDIKYLFDKDKVQNISNGNFEEGTHDLQFTECGSSDKIECALIKTENTVELLQDPSTTHAKHGNDVSRTVDDVNKETDSPRDTVKHIVDDTKSTILTEFTRGGFGVCFYTEKQCSFTYRITSSSVDSGIGDELHESFDNLD